ncbi:hypothetical protein [Hyphobacterium sp.]|uniref:hypothetical protein n=1 Tax=Hyphobacterium sp. TaxID=2004662 RepID=UPI003BAC70E6
MLALTLSVAALLAAAWAFVTGLLTVHRHRDVWPHFSARDARCARLDSVAYALLTFSVGMAFLHVFIYGSEMVRLLAAKPSALLTGTEHSYLGQFLTVGSLSLWGFVHLFLDRLLDLAEVRYVLARCNLWRRP